MDSPAVDQLKMLVPSWDFLICRRVCEWLEETCNIKNGHASFLSRHPYRGVIEGIYCLIDATHLVETTRSITRAEQILGLATVLLHEAAQNGHTYIPCGEIWCAIKEKMPTPGPGESPVTLMQIESVIDLHPKTIAQDRMGRHFLPEHKLAEEIVGKWISRAIAGNRPLGDTTFPAQLTATDEASPFPYTPAQSEAVASIITSTKTRLHILTGGPGTGKTAVMRLLAAQCRKQAIRLSFAAPTGMAAKVLSARLQDLQMMATTVHVLLEGSTTKFQRDEANPLDLDLLVVDEAGMLDIQLLSHVVRALPAHAHLLLVGDDEQLLSVGPGQILFDCKGIEGTNRHMLKGSHRNAGAIHQLVQNVAAGSFSLPNSNNVSLNERFDQAAFETQYQNACARHGAHNVGVLLPTKGGGSAIAYRGVAGFNLGLQSLMNKDGVPVPGTGLRVGDRIIVRANLRSEVTTPGGGSGMASVANGDRGVIVSASSSRSVLLRLDAAPHQLCSMPLAIARKHLQLGYASTIHLAQGSEFSCVFLVLQDHASDFINRSVLLTGLSRAREELAIYGERRQLQRIASRQAPPRRSALIEQVHHWKSYV